MMLELSTYNQTSSDSFANAATFGLLVLLELSESDA